MTARNPAIVVIGEALIDVVHRPAGIDESPGGSPANVALTLGRLERSPTLLTALAEDERGGRVRRWLQASGVHVCAAPVTRTATATAFLDETGAASYEFDLTWGLCADPASLAASGLGSADVVHTGSVAAVLEPGARDIAAIIEGARASATITYDPNIRPSLVDGDRARVRRNAEALVRLADVVKASDEDVRWLHPGRDIVDVAREWQRIGPALVVVTLGAGGAIGVTAEAVVTVPAVPTRLVDTVGAGDTFMGALIDGILTLGGGAGALRTAPAMGTDDLEALLLRSARAAAITVSRPGADPPRLAELVAGAR